MKKTNLFVKKNTISLKDNIVAGFMPGEGYEYYQVSNSQNIFENPSIWGELVNVYIRYDKEYDNYERQVFNIGNFVENVGGFYSGIFVIGVLLVPFFSEKLFYASLINQIY